MCIAEQGPAEGIPDDLKRDKHAECIYDVQKTSHIAEQVKNLVGIHAVDSSLRGNSEVNV